MASWKKILGIFQNILRAPCLSVSTHLLLQMSHSHIHSHTGPWPRDKLGLKGFIVRTNADIEI